MTIVNQAPKAAQAREKKDLFITCSQGLEPILAQELAGLGFDDSALGYRGVYVAYTSLTDIYRINYCSRIAGRVLLPLSRFRCRDVASLQRGVASIDWMRYIAPGKTFAIDANVSHKELRNSLFAAQLVKDGICDQFRAKTGERPNVDIKAPDVQINLFIHNDLASISFDTSGTPLYKRGYRQESVEAPLQESLAAAMLCLAGYKGDEILCDPFCGSGTFLIEAALIATHTPPGFLRPKWDFMNLPEFSQEEWLKVKAQADLPRIAMPAGRLFGCDTNKDSVRSSKINARTAGFHQAIEITQQDFRDYTPPIPPTFLITNPPHGRRLDDVDYLRSIYRALGEFMKSKMAKPSRGFVFTGSIELAKEVGLAAKRRHVISNAGIDSRLLEFDLY